MSLKIKHIKCVIEIFSEIVKIVPIADKYHKLTAEAVKELSTLENHRCSDDYDVE